MPSALPPAIYLFSDHDLMLLKSNPFKCDLESKSRNTIGSDQFQSKTNQTHQNQTENHQI